MIAFIETSIDYQPLIELAHSAELKTGSQEPVSSGELPFYQALLQLFRSELDGGKRLAHLKALYVDGLIQEAANSFDQDALIRVRHIAAQAISSAYSEAA